MKIDMSNFNNLTLDEKRDVLTTLLLDRELIVEFTKISGEKRIMPCTLSPTLIPIKTDFVLTISEQTEKKERKENPNVIKVFCTDKQEWRSFRIDSVITISEIH